MEGVYRPNEGQRVLRLLMVLGSLMPLFLFLMIRGAPIVASEPVVQHEWFRSGCSFLIALAAGGMAYRIWYAGKRKDTKSLVVEECTDVRDHLIVYLFAILIPLYQNSFATMNDVWSGIAVFLFVVYLLFHLNLHYMNLVFGMAGYRVYLLKPANDENPFAGRTAHVLITKRRFLKKGERIDTRRISDTVFIEYEDRR